MNLHIPRSVSSRPCRVLVAVLLSFVCIAPRLTLAQGGATLEVTPSGSAPAGSTVTVKWSGPNGPGDYTTVVRRGARPADYLNYQQTSSGRTPVNPVSIVLPAEPGAYEIRYVLGSARGVLASVPYEVVGVVATIAAPASVAPGASFELSWSGPNNGGDWVTIVAAGAAPRAYGSYVDARNGRSDTRTGNRVATLRAPAQPGRYELRYVQQGSRVIGTRVIEVAVGAAAAGAAGGGAAAGAAGGAAGAADIKTAGGGAAAAGITDSKTPATLTPTGVVNSRSTQTPRAGQTAIITDPAKPTCIVLSDVVEMWDRFLADVTAFYAMRLSAAMSAAERTQLEKDRAQALATASNAKSKSVAEISKMLEQSKCVPGDPVLNAIRAMSEALLMTAPAAAPSAPGR